MVLGAALLGAAESGAALLAGAAADVTDDADDTGDAADAEPPADDAALAPDETASAAVGALAHPASANDAAATAASRDDENMRVERMSGLQTLVDDNASQSVS